MIHIRRICVSVSMLAIMVASSMYASETSHLSLESCILSARKNNPDLKFSAAGVLEMQKQIDVARSQFGPNVTLNASSKLQSDIPELVQASTILSTPLGEIQIPGATRSLGDYDVHSIDLEINQILYAGGRLHGAAALSEYGAELAESQRILLQRNLDSRVSLQYIAFSRSIEMLEVSQKTLKLALSHADDIQNRLDAGSLTTNEVLKAKLRVSEAESASISASLQVRLAQEKLKTLIGANLDPAQIPQALQISQIRLGIPNIESSMNEAAVSRMEFRILEMQIKMSEKQLDQIRRERAPNVYAFARASYGKPGLDFVKNEWMDSYIAGFQCSLNLWDNRRILSREAALLSHIEKLRLQKQVVSSQVRLELTQAILSLEDSRKRLEVVERAVLQAEENFRVTLNKFQEGTLTNTDYLDADTLLSNASINLIVAKADIDHAWLSYFASVGEDLLEEEWMR